jgi:hypothetical protein
MSVCDGRFERWGKESPMKHETRGSARGGRTEKDRRGANTSEEGPGGGQHEGDGRKRTDRGPTRAKKDRAGGARGVQYALGSH